MKGEKHMEDNLKSYLANVILEHLENVEFDGSYYHIVLEGSGTIISLSNEDYCILKEWKEL